MRIVEEFSLLVLTLSSAEATRPTEPWRNAAPKTDNAHDGYHTAPNYDRGYRNNSNFRGRNKYEGPFAHRALLIVSSATWNSTSLACIPTTTTVTLPLGSNTGFRSSSASKRASRQSSNHSTRAYPFGNYTTPWHNSYVAHHLER